MSSESNDEQLERVRREIRAQAALLHERPLLARVPPTALPAADAIDRARLRYRIGELTDLHYRAFVEHAFRALLKRAPQAHEGDARIAQLAAGGTKAGILGDLRWSAEGRRVGVRVGGLASRYAMAKARRIPVLGYLLDWCVSLAALPMLARHQRASDAQVAAGDEAAAAAQRAIAARLEQRVDDLHAFAHELAVARDTLTHELAVARGTLTQALVDIEATMRGRVEALEGATHTHAARLDELELLRRQVYSINRWTDAVDHAFEAIERTAAAQRSARGLRVRRVVDAFAKADAPRIARNNAWADRLAASLPLGARVIALVGARDWLAQLATHGLEVIEAGADDVFDAFATGSGPNRPNDVIADLAADSADALATLALPVVARGFPLDELLDEAARVVRPGGLLLLAFAREPVALAHTLAGEPDGALDVDLLVTALGAFGFASIERVDGADGTPALLARKNPT